MCYRFFRNKGAVAGVFVIVGLAAASIVLFIFFYVRRRRRTQRLEHDAAVASTLAAAGYNRRPLDDDDEKQMSPRRSSVPSATTLPNSSFSSAQQLALATGGRPPTAEGYATAPPTPGAGSDFDPYAAIGTVHPPPPAVFPTQARKDGYAPARTASPPPGAYDRSRRQTQSTSTSASWGHAAKGSVASTEPLLSGYYSGATTEPSTPALGPTLNLVADEGGGRRGGRERERERERESGTSSSSVYSEDEPEVPETKPRLEVRRAFLLWRAVLHFVSFHSG